MSHEIIITDCITGEELNRIRLTAFYNFIYDFRGRPYTNDNRPPKMSTLEMMQYISKYHLERDFNMAMVKLTDLFGSVSVSLAMIATIHKNFDIV